MEPNLISTICDLLKKSNRINFHPNSELEFTIRVSDPMGRAGEKQIRFADIDNEENLMAAINQAESDLLEVKV